MTSITVRNVKIGDSKPKVVIPITGHTALSIFDEINVLPKGNFDIIEWRVDYFKYVKKVDNVIEIASKIRDLLPTIPLLFTYRTQHKEAIENISDTCYATLNNAIITSGYIDIIDIEITKNNSITKRLIDNAHKNSVTVLASHHNFHTTPCKHDIFTYLNKMYQLNADIAKIAVMPTSFNDVLSLLSIADEIRTHNITCPIVMIAMGKIGRISRIACELFGSSLTFAASRHNSAPGQLSADTIYPILSRLHDN